MFARLNAVANNLRTLKKISELQINRLYIIEGLRKITTKFGEKVIVEIEDHVYCYLPARVSKELLANDEAAFKDFQARLETTSVSLRRLEGSYNPIEFVANPAPPPDSSDSE